MNSNTSAPEQSQIVTQYVTDWISTGKAAKLMGYSPDYFARKFEGIIPSRRLEGKHRRWLRSAVLVLAAEPALPEAI